VEVREKIQGELHPATATSLNNLALLYQSMGKYADAAKLLQRSLEIRRKVLGEEHPDVAISFNNLGRANELMGQYAKAEPLYKHGLEIQKNIPRERSADPAIILDNLGGLYLALGQFAKAELLYQRALEIRRKVLGAQHPDTAKGLNNLALVYQASGRSEKAEPLLREALSICQRVLGKQHPDTARSLNNLAMWHRSRDQYAKAESLYEQALAIEKKNVGEDHPDTAETLQNLANLNYLAGRYDKAEPLYQEALAVFKKVLGEQHPETATCLGNLAGLDWSMGQYAKAEPLLRQALASSQRLLVHSFGVLSEREQLAYEANSRFQLDEYLALSGSPEYISAFGPQSVGAAEVYRYVLCGKGIVTAQQAFIHIGLRANKSPKLNRWFQQLQEDSRLLATFRLAPPNQPERLRAWQEEIARLDEERNTVQQKLAAESDEFRRLEESLQADGDQVRKLQHRLSAKTALIDFLEYTHFSPPPDKKGPLRRERRLTAFVVRTGSVQRVDLGPVAPLATAAERWRLAIVKGLGRANDAASGELDGGNLRQAPQQFLREHLIDPLTPHLQGADLALISPDGFVTQVPFAALPGRTKGSYFIEEMSVAVVPVPSDLPVLLSSTVGESAGDPSLLLVGGVDFGGDPGSVLVATNDMTPSQHRSAERGRDRLAFGPLPGTAHEIEEIEKTFHERFADREIEILDKSDATEQRFRLEAPKHRWLHVATHGFFANAGIPSALDRHNEEGRHTEGGGFGFQLQDEGIDPALLSGIVFAGANRDVGSAETSTLDFSKETDDGILTALEISELDLRNVDLAVLSACETGLGRVAGGEGVLGLQRAFQTAGARTCVTSLWKVDDSATELLMKEFYANLWQRKLGKLDSLRQAQLTMLRRYDAAENRLRGLSRVVRLPESAAPSNSSRPAPKYWAPFILSGDWR
jgi:CHAT domain-containing protein/Tfp pilus assembly protein PilF